MKNIPNLITLLNLFFGCIAILFILQNGVTISYTQEGAQYIDLPEKIWMASLFIGLAAVVDFFDGFVARLLKADSAMGKELDSLADVVSFGVAPGFIIYQFLRMSFVREVDGLDVSLLWLVPAFFIPCAAAYRLARFNLDTEQQFGFKGVPTPAVGLLVASIPLIYWYGESEWIVRLLMNKWFLYTLIFALSYLMVSKLPLMSLKFSDYSIKNNLSKIILLVVSVLLIVSLKWLAVPAIFIIYIILSLTTGRAHSKT
jgi:CDP-diacylglycerol---serine O-phosphatidyltransferase